MKLGCSVVNVRTTACDVYIGRPSIFGNPYTVAKHGRDAALALFRKYFASRIQTDHEYRARVVSLTGKRLGCFCKPLQCHGDVIAEWVNRQDSTMTDESNTESPAVTGDEPECPQCGKSWLGDPIPETAREHFGGATHFRRCIAIECGGRVEHFKCPDCGFIFDRA